METDLVEGTGDFDVAWHFGCQNAENFGDVFCRDDELHRADGLVKDLFFHSEPVGIRTCERDRRAVDVHVDAGEDGTTLVI